MMDQNRMSFKQIVRSKGYRTPDVSGSLSNRLVIHRHNKRKVLNNEEVQ